jgi:hypothetical protein
MDISEGPTPIRAKTWSFYTALFLAVLPLWSSVPLAWIFTARSFIAGSFSILFYVALGEVLFSIYYTYLAHHVSGPSPQGPANPEEVQVAYIRLLKTDQEESASFSWTDTTLELLIFVTVFEHGFAKFPGPQSNSSKCGNGFIGPCIIQSYLP